MVCTTAVKLAQEIAGYLATKRETILQKPFESRDLVGPVQSALQNVVLVHCLLCPQRTTLWPVKNSGLRQDIIDDGEHQSY